jgi:Trk-type K+ transport system membrane component
MKRLIIAIIDKLIETYNYTVIQISKDWFIPLRLLYMAAAIIVYIFSILVIIAVVLIVVLIVIPLSLFTEREPRTNP